MKDKYKSMRKDVLGIYIINNMQGEYGSAWIHFIKTCEFWKVCNHPL